MPNQIVVRPPFRKRGQMPFWYGSRLRADVTGSGGVEIGGSATVEFIHAASVDTDVVLEWDFDNDGDFSESVEDITSKALSIETRTGRDWPSLLTGRAGPGKLRATLRNDDNRFNYFNSSSPLATPPFSLKTGRKVRLRTSDANNPDPVLLAKDRFGRADGSLGTPEVGAAWSEPFTDDFAIETGHAVATGSTNDAHMAVIDVGETDYYAQVDLSVVGLPSSVAGIVYRYQDSDDYSLCVLDAFNEAIFIYDFVSGSGSLVATRAIEVYSGMTLGVLVSGNTVTAYVEGVPWVSGAAIQTDETEVGIFALWATASTRPELDNFYVWDGLPQTVEGILWTGDVADCHPSVVAGPEKRAELSASGWLSKMATHTIAPPTSVSGKSTGLLVGDTLSMSRLLHPPGNIDEGDISTGPFSFEQTDALSVARDVEELEFGFLYESQEGPIGFASRSARDGSVSQVTFTDDPSGQFKYTAVELMDWKREVYNRVSAGVSPYSEGVEAVLFTDPGPYVLTPGQSVTITASYPSGTVARWTGHTRDVNGTPVSSLNPSSASPVFTISYNSGVGGPSQNHTDIEVSGIPFVRGDVQAVVVDDIDSQDDHNSIRTYVNPANLFASVDDATTYANLVLSQYADDRPIISITFCASKSPAYRAQAIRRRVGDRITLVADNNSGLGIDQDFYIESIGHKFTEGNTLWHTTWELSPL